MPQLLWNASRSTPDGHKVYEYYYVGKLLWPSEINFWYKRLQSLQESFNTTIASAQGHLKATCINYGLAIP